MNIATETRARNTAIRLRLNRRSKKKQQIGRDVEELLQEIERLRSLVTRLIVK